MTSNAGISWQAARSIYDPGPNNQTIGNQVVVLPNGNLLDVFTELDTASGGAVTASVRVTQSLDKGTTWSMPRWSISSLQAVGTTDPRNGAVVRDGADLVSVSVSPGGVVYVAWQDSRFSGGQRDGIAMTQSSDGGVTWSAPVQVNADTTVQAFTPTINVRADGAIAVTYFDLRNNISPACFSPTAGWWSRATAVRPSRVAPVRPVRSRPGAGLGRAVPRRLRVADLGQRRVPAVLRADRRRDCGAQRRLHLVPAASLRPRPASSRSRPRLASALTPAATRRVMERIRLTQRQRLLGH